MNSERINILYFNKQRQFVFYQIVGLELWGGPCCLPRGTIFCRFQCSFFLRVDVDPCQRTVITIYLPMWIDSEFVATYFSRREVLTVLSLPLLASNARLGQYWFPDLILILFPAPQQFLDCQVCSVRSGGVRGNEKEVVLLKADRGRNVSGDCLSENACSLTSQFNVFGIVGVNASNLSPTNNS